MVGVRYACAGCEAKCVSWREFGDAGDGSFLRPRR
jgi:hypothetical protein